MRTHLHNFRPHARRGTALALIIIVSVVVTGLVMTLAWAAGAQSQSVTQQRNLDRALYIAEAGMQRMAWYCRNSQLNAVAGQSLSGSVNGGTYTASYTVVSGSTIRVTSTGVYSGASYTLAVNITPPSGGVAAFASVGDFDNKNITVVGDVAVGGTYTNGGNGSTDGNLTYTVTATNTSAVTGTIAQSAFQTIDFNALGATLTGTSGAIAGLSGTGRTYNFNAAGGTNKVIYVTGDVTNPAFSGTGTIYINGNITFTNPNTTVGSSSNPVNIVCSGKITFEKKSTVYGSLYAGGNIDRAQLDVVGVVYSGGVFKANSGMCSMTTPSSGAPWFDPRLTSGAAATMTVTNYTGPGI